MHRRGSAGGWRLLLRCHAPSTRCTGAPCWRAPAAACGAGLFSAARSFSGRRSRSRLLLGGARLFHIPGHACGRAPPSCAAAGCRCVAFAKQALIPELCAPQHWYCRAPCAVRDPNALRGPDGAQRARRVEPARPAPRRGARFPGGLPSPQTWVETFPGLGRQQLWGAKLQWTNP